MLKVSCSAFVDEEVNPSNVVSLQVIYVKVEQARIKATRRSFQEYILRKISVHMQSRVERIAVEI